MKIQRISGLGCLLVAIIGIFVISLIGRFTMTMLGFLFGNPIGWLILAAIVFYAWRNKPKVRVYHQTDRSGNVVSSQPRKLNDEYVTLDEEQERSDN